MELLYARMFPFVDYGIDLDLMAELDKDIRITKLSNIPTDTGRVN